MSDSQQEDQRNRLQVNRRQEECSSLYVPDEQEFDDESLDESSSNKQISLKPSHSERSQLVSSKGKIRDDWNQQCSKVESMADQKKHMRVLTQGYLNIQSDKASNNLVSKDALSNSQNSFLPMGPIGSSPKNESIAQKHIEEEKRKSLNKEPGFNPSQFDNFAGEIKKQEKAISRRSHGNEANKQSQQNIPDLYPNYKNSIPSQQQRPRSTFEKMSNGTSKKQEEEKKPQPNQPQKKEKKKPETTLSNYIQLLYNKILAPELIVEEESEEMSVAKDESRQKVPSIELSSKKESRDLAAEDPSEVPNIIIEESEEVKSQFNKQNLKKSQTFMKLNNPDSLFQPKPRLSKMHTTKDIVVKRSSFFNFDPVPKSYVYLAKGLSGVVDVDQPEIKNYRSAFFEEDKDLEDYHKQLKEALIVQFQKEINIQHEQVKDEYDSWVCKFQSQYQKISQFKKTLVFDLDETLVRAQKEEPENGYDARITVINPADDDQYYIYVKFRPHLFEMLTNLKNHYELILFTAASDQYADIVLQTFEGHQYFDHILSRKQCLFIFEYDVFVKDLSILLNGRTLKDILIVDNKIKSYSSNLENGIPITSYYGQENDQMLSKLEQYLLRLKDTSDVRKTILEDFFLNNINSIQKDKIFNTIEIKACVKKAQGQKEPTAKEKKDHFLNAKAGKQSGSKKLNINIKVESL